MWSAFDNAGETSFVGFAKVCSEKLQTSRSSTAVLVYPFQSPFFNRSENQRWGLDKQGLIALACLPVSFYRI